VLLSLAFSSAQGVETSPQSFAYGMRIDTPASAAAYRVRLPLAVYQQTFRTELADLRVFNAQREPVPYAMRRAPNRPPTTTDTQLPLFPLPSGARIALDGLRVTIDSPGSAVNVQTRIAGLSSNPVNQYILDGRVRHGPVVGLRLEWPPTDIPYSGQLRVEASDDLNLWRTVLPSAPIVNLRAGDQAIVENRVPLPATTANFWRLTWIGTAPPLTLSSTFAESADAPQRAHEVLAVKGARDPANPGSYLFDLGAHPPVDRVTLLLPTVNSLVQADLSSRASPRDAWHSVDRLSVYRLRAADGEVKSPPTQISVDRDRYWRVRAPEGDAPMQSPMQLQVEWVPDEVTFLAQGPGPYLLAYGSSRVTAQESDLGPVPRSIEIADAAVGSPVSLGGPSQLSVQPQPFPRMRFVLWGILVLAVIGLGWMAYQLIAEGSGEGRSG
jgi:hypothetical protein